MNELLEKFEAGSFVKFSWGSGAFLRLDRSLPFLLLFRGGGRGSPLSSLVTTEAAYLLAEPEEDCSEVLRLLIEQRKAEFGSFLLLELWVSDDAELESDFVVHTGKKWAAESLSESLVASLQRISRYQKTTAVLSKTKPRPPGLSRACKVDCHVLGLEIKPFFLDETGAPYPLSIRALRRGLAKVLRRLFFNFSNKYTALTPPNFQTLGPRAIVKKVWKVDSALAEVSAKFSLLLQVSPLNSHQSWQRFKKSKFTEIPRFEYRPTPFEPNDIKRELLAIPVEQVGDPTLAHLFQEKQHQIETKINMIAKRRTAHFLYGSLSLYGGVEPEILKVAKKILKLISPRQRDAEPSKIKAEEFAKLAQEEVDYYRAQWSKFSPRVELRDDIGASVLCDRGHLLIGTRAELSASRVQPLLHHEIGTHLLTYYNGHAQPLKLLSLGFADFLQLQEGLAVLSEFLSGPPSAPRMRWLALRVVAVHTMLSGADFVECFRTLRERYQPASQPLFDLVMRVYRGGGFTKDAVYLSGLVKLFQKLAAGAELEGLFVGKIGLQHLPIIRELQHRKVLLEAPLRPRVLGIEVAQTRLALIRGGLSVPDMLERFLPDSL